MKMHPSAHTHTHQATQTKKKKQPTQQKNKGKSSQKEAAPTRITPSGDKTNKNDTKVTQKSHLKLTQN